MDTTGGTWPRRGGAVGLQEAQREAMAKSQSWKKPCAFTTEQEEEVAQRRKQPPSPRYLSTCHVNGHPPHTSHCSGERQRGEWDKGLPPSSAQSLQLVVKT